MDPKQTAAAASGAGVSGECDVKRICAVTPCQPKNKSPVVYMTRVDTFSAAHRLHSTEMSEQQNKTLYGACNNPNGHGHNYKVEVTVKGEIDEQTGMVVNLTDLKHYIKVAVTDVLDHKNIDKDIPYFQDVISTGENIVVFIWNSLAPLLNNCSLHKVRLYETDKNVFTYFGE